MADEEYIVEWIEKCVTSPKAKLKNVVQKMETESMRQLSNMELAFIQRNYVQVLLKLWTGQSLEKVDQGIESTDMSTELSALLNQLDSIRGLKDIPLLEAESKLKSWCDGELLRLILSQRDVFESTPYSSTLVNNYFKQFKTSCDEKLCAQHLSDRNNAEKHLNFISALADFLSFVNLDIKRPKMFADYFLQNYVVNDNSNGRELLERLVERCAIHFKDDPSVEVENFVASANSLAIDEWTPRLQSLTKETCRKLLLPLVTAEITTEGERKIVTVKGIAILVSEMKKQMKELKDECNAQEVQMIGLASVHVDCDLERDIWHGINVVVVTDKLFVDGDFRWDVSGQSSDDQLGTAPSGQHPGDDGLAGNHGQPGKSGGNVYIICNEMFHAERWTIASCGGLGSNGQNGGHGQNGKDGKNGATKWSEKDFLLNLPPMSKSMWFGQSHINVNRTLVTLKSILPRENRDYGKDVGLVRRDDGESFFIEGTPNNGGTITASFVQNFWCTYRHSLVLCKGARGHAGQKGGKGGQGGNGGQGGYGGSITIENVFGEPLGGPICKETRGTFGQKGQDGNGGRHGRHGKSAGDVGYIEKVYTFGDYGYKTNLFGFDNDVALYIKYSSLEPKSEPYAYCYPPGRGFQYATLEYTSRPASDVGTQKEKTTNGRLNRTENDTEAVKKKAVTRQSLGQHVTQVLERKQMSQSFQANMASMMESSLSTDVNLNERAAIEEENEIECEIKSAFVRRMDSQRLQDSSRSSNSKTSKGGCIAEDIYDPYYSENGVQGSTFCFRCLSREPLTKLEEATDQPIENDAVRLRPNALVRCLERLSTTGGVDNILHCIFGQIESFDSYLCNNTETYRKHISTYILANGTEHHHTFSCLVKRFVFEVNEDDKDFPVANMKREEYFKFKDDHQLWKIMEGVQNELKEEIVKSENKKLMKVLDKYEKTLEDKVNYVINRYLSNETNYDEGDKSAGTWEEAWSSCGPKFKTIVKRLKEKFDWEEVAKSNALMEEYAKYVQSPLTTLGRSELELIALIYDKKIHVYVADDRNDPNNDDNLPPFEFNETLNSGGSEDHFILYEKDAWQKLQVNPKLRQFFEQRARQADNLRQQTETNVKSQSAREEKTIIATEFKNLSSWLELNYTKNQQVVTAILMLNPQYGDTPDVLCKLIGRHLTLKGKKSINLNVDLVDEFASDICSLSQRVLDYNSRDLDAIFYLHIVDKFCPHRWQYEFLLQEMEEKISVVLQPEERKSWRCALYKLNGHMLSLLRDRLFASGEKNSSLTTEKLGKTLNMLAGDFLFTEADIIRLGHLTINDWYFELKSKMWEKQVDNLLPSLVRLEDKKEIVYLLLELENKKGEEFCHQLAKECQHPTVKSGSNIAKLLEQKLYSDGSSEYSLLVNSGQERTIEEIISVMKTDGNTSTGVESQLEDIKLNVVISKSEAITLEKMNSIRRLDSLSLEDIKSWSLKETEFKARNLSLNEFLFIYDRAIQLKMQFRLRDTQRVTITSLLYNNTTSLAQVSTGEGKSLIVAGVAIYRALCGLKIDIITSNSVLALRDSNSSVADGGLRDLYETFGVSVSNNCSEVDDDRVRCYDFSVVYGELANFQRDYLLDTFYGRNIRGDRRFDCVIVDEVDCMLLDRGNNMLYLSHDIPGMEMLESLYVFVWEKIRTSRDTSDSLEQIKSDVLYDLFGTITKDDLQAIDSSLKDNPSEKNAIWSYLIKNEIIDKRGRLKVEDVGKIQNLNYPNARLNPKLTLTLNYYLRNVIERDRRIRIPERFLSFVDQHLESWLANAVRALVLNADEHYVVDQDRSGTSPDLNPQVIIIDPDTGTDQTTSQWDGSLHQFLQLKEGCQISLQSLKAVFISNVTYIKRYDKLTGLTGTLGSQPERDFLQQTYECDFFTLPTAYPKMFTVKRAQVVKTEEKWLDAIADETRQTILNEKARSMVIFCKSINDVKMTHQRLREIFQTEISTKKMKIHRYTRDYEKFEFESNELDVGHVIVATNLAGRGTDIKISQTLRDNGGLHICLTYLPDNVRIEEQALGRAGRKGAPGSGILILCESPETMDKTESWGSSKIFDMKEERNRQELQRISNLADDFYRNIGKQEKCFEQFSRHYAKLKRQLDGQRDSVEIDMICLSALDRWALWLDSIDDGETFESQSIEKVLKKLKDELIDELELSSDISWVTPARSITMAKHLATRTENPNVSMAATLLDRLIESKDQNFFYPAAHYYRALVIVKQGKFRQEKAKFIRTLRAAEALLEQHVALQMSYSQIVSQTLTKPGGAENSFCDIEAYKRQKENVVKIMEHFQSSIRSLLGSHCSVSGLQEAGIDEAKVDAYFENLEYSSCITCQINDVDSVPNRDSAIQQVADEYGVKKDSLLQFLNANEHRCNVTEKEMEKILKNSGIVQCTRKAFWNLLVQTEVFYDVHKCAVLSVSDCDGISGFNPYQKINDEIGMANYVLYNPTFSTQTELLEKNKVLLRKDYLKSILSTNEYRRKKKSFESNKIARLDFNKLKTIDLRALGQLSLEALNYSTKIHPEDCQHIWDALIVQGIIDDQGNLAQDYKHQQFGFPQCPIYENPVRRLVERTFLAETVRRQWLNEKDPDRFKAIADLAIKPYQDMLADLMRAHVISGARVNEDVEDTEKVVTTITNDTQDSGRILSFLKNHQAVYVTLETPGAALESIELSIRQRSDFNNVSTELYVFRLLGFDHVIEMKEERRSWAMILRAILIIVIGVVQVILGALIQMKFAGVMAHVGSGFMSEGISDILFAVSALWSGNNFTWADYGRHKLMSIAITASTMGIAAVFSRGVKFFKYGFKTVGPGFKEGGKIVAQSASAMKLTTGTIVKQVAKTSCIKIGQSVALGLLSNQIESLVNSQLANLCCKLGKTLIEEINKVVVKKSIDMNETLNRLYRLHGPVEAQRLVSEKLQKVTTGWVQKGLEWLSKMVGSISAGLNQALNKRQMAGAVSTAVAIAAKVMNFISKCVDKFCIIIKLIDVLVMRTKQFHSELNECNKKSTKELGDVDASEIEAFQQKVQDDMQTALGREAGQMIESWTTEMLQGAAKQVVTFTTRSIKYAHRVHKENRYSEALRKFQDEQRKASQSSGEQGSNKTTRSPPSEVHIKSCLKLMRKTKDPKLFAALIREGIPVDRFCCDALSSALPAVLQRLGVPNADVTVRIESSDDHLVHESHPANPNVIVIKVERAVDGQSLGHFYSKDGTSDAAFNSANARYDCLFHCLANQIKANRNVELNPTRLREEAASMVEKDPSVSQAIRSGWHKYTFDKGFYGGAKYFRNIKHSFGMCGSNRETKKYSKRGQVESDHQPAKSMWKEAKDERIQNLKENDFPSMSIPTEMHKKTLNYAGRAKSNNQFNQQQRKYMRAGQYSEAIFHSVNENWLKPIFKREPLQVMEKVYKNLTVGYLRCALDVKIIDHREAEFLKRKIKQEYEEALEFRGLVGSALAEA